MRNVRATVWKHAPSSWSGPRLAGSLCLLAALGWTAPILGQADAAAVEDRGLVAESVEVLLATRSQQGIIEQLAATESRLEEAIQRNSEARYHAKTVFAAPLDSGQLVDLATLRKARVLQVETKVATGVGQEVYTAWFGGLGLYEGTLSEQLRFFEDHLGETWRRLAERRRLRTATPLPKRPLRFFAVEWVLPARDLLGAMRDGSAAAVALVGEGETLEDSLERAPKRALDSHGLHGRPVAATPELEGGAQEIGGLHKMGVVAPCGGPGSSENCPPDATWLPSSSFGLGAGSDFSSVVVNRAGVQTFTEGDFLTQVRWAPVVPPARRINTAAFVDTAAVHCDPDIDLGDLSAPCDRDDLDAVFVPGATFESEGLVPNATCLLPVRTGTSVDQTAGCFLPTFGFTNLPSAYLDTTVADSRTPLNAAIGTVAPDRILEGFAYETYVYFWAFGTQIVLGQKAKHIGQIGTDSFLCPLPSQFCTFSVDTTKLDEAIYLPVVF